MADTGRKDLKRTSPTHQAPLQAKLAKKGTIHSIPKESNAENLLEWGCFGVQSLHIAKGDLQLVEEATDLLLQCFLNSNLCTSPTFKKAKVLIATIQDKTMEIMDENVHKYDSENCKCPAIIANSVLRKRFDFSKWDRITAVSAYYLIHSEFLQSGPPKWRHIRIQGPNDSTCNTISHSTLCSEEELESGLQSRESGRSHDTPFDGTLVIRLELSVV
eukprot:878322-Rhodomonas_salina.1